MKLILAILFIMVVTRLSGQTDSATIKKDTTGRSYLLQNVTRNGVTMPEIDIKEVIIVARPTASQKSQYRKYEKLIGNIKKVYPYALLVRVKLEQVNQDLKNLDNERARKAYVKNVEKDVFKQYEGDIRDMTITQGRLLIKLIDRETQNTSYELIRDYRGKFSAAFWQSIARIFGTNLKEHYDPYGDDALIEAIINDMDAGRL